MDSVLSTGGLARRARIDDDVAGAAADEDAVEGT